MARATIIEMISSLEVVGTLKKSGILFVPVPVLDGKDHELLKAMVMQRLDKILKEAEDAG